MIQVLGPPVAPVLSGKEYSFLHLLRGFPTTECVSCDQQRDGDLGPGAWVRGPDLPPTLGGLEQVN